MAGYWEFPGGKVNRGEVPEEALCRELQEELGIDVTPDALQPITFASQIYKRFHLLMPLYHCHTWKGNVTSCEKQNLTWIEADRFSDAVQHQYKLLPTDLPLIPHVEIYLSAFMQKPVISSPPKLTIF